jgi:dsRNA-specific ribonuclease
MDFLLRKKQLPKHNSLHNNDSSASSSLNKHKYNPHHNNPNNSNHKNQNHNQNHKHKSSFHRPSSQEKPAKPVVSSINISDIDNINNDNHSKDNDNEKKHILEQATPVVKDEIDDENKKINPYNFSNRFIKKNEIENILRRYGVFQTINDLNLYQQAFTHDSYCWNHTNEIMKRDEVEIVNKPEGAIELQDISYQRLEFLGDRVVNLIIAFYLFERYPQQNEGFLTKIYSKIIDSKGLAKLARKVNFGQYILFSRHLDEKNNARTKDKYLEDCFEAFIGALFYDFTTKLNATGYVTAADFNIGPGFQICQKFIVNLIEDEETCIDFVELIGKDRNYKQKMNMYFQTFGLKGRYTVERNENVYILENDGEIVFGSDYDDDAPSEYLYQDRIWWVSLKDNQDKVYGTAYARERQQAEQKCAYLSLIKLGREKNDLEFDDPELEEWIIAYNSKHTK